ncbi:hypothetical protein ACIOMR_21895 [Pseudomonas sp. NPDC087814]|uniref:hypothetical protein n=1 Tax=Pseudomonas sp. NPDC087814 TaxID=3364450 RepID=UPI0038176B6E
MEDFNDVERLNQEWITLNAIRGMIKIATKGDMSKGTYDNSLEFGGQLYPDLLGPEKSLLRRERESDTVKEFRQRAELQSLKLNKEVTALELLEQEIEELNSLLPLAKRDKENLKNTDQLKRKLSTYEKAREELTPLGHSENKLIFRDAYNVDRKLPELTNGIGKKDFQLPDGNHLRLRVLHPDQPEHITGADIIYERHDYETETVSVVVVQYKIWDGKKIYLSDERLNKQLERLTCFTCGKGLCKDIENEAPYRFPHCSAFLRPTDKLQNPNQKLISSGEHLPICKIDKLRSEIKEVESRGKLEYEKIRSTSLSSELFEHMFNRGKIGSKPLTYDELKELYKDSSIIDKSETVVIYAQEF